MSDLYPLAKTAQIPRNGIINLLNEPAIGQILVGSFVRVLLELLDHHEDYLLARIDGIDHGEPYSGFSQNATQTTTVLLRLQLPRSLTGINGMLYQLNSISNSPMTVDEYERWIRETQEEFALPTAPELVAISERIRPFIERRRGGTGNGPQQQPAAAAAAAGNVAVQPSIAARPIGAPTSGGGGGGQDLNMTRKETRYTNNASSPRSGAASGAVATTGNGEDELLPTRSQIHHQILNELRDNHAPFAKDIQEFKSTQLRLSERDLIDYLENVRNAIMSKRSSCVVCMDQVASVIMLPCKHKVLCRFCAASVSSCPCCREIAVELFEPLEI